MRNDLPPTSLELRSLVRSTGELELSLVDVKIPAPADNEVTVRVEAAHVPVPRELALEEIAAYAAQATGTKCLVRPNRI